MQAYDLKASQELGVGYQWLLLFLGVAVGPALSIFITVSENLTGPEMFLIAVFTSGLWWQHLRNRPTAGGRNLSSAAGMFATYLDADLRVATKLTSRDVLFFVLSLAGLVVGAFVFHHVPDYFKVVLILVCIFAFRRVAIFIADAWRQLRGSSKPQALMGTDQQFVVRGATKAMSYTLAACLILAFGVDAS